MLRVLCLLECIASNPIILDAYEHVVELNTQSVHKCCLNSRFGAVIAKTAVTLTVELKTTNLVHSHSVNPIRLE